MSTTMGQIDDFLAQRRIAIVGASRDPKELSHVLWQELRQRRYEAVPVNPTTTELDGQPCYPSVGAVDPPVQAALIMTPASAAADVVDACAAAGIHHVWLYGGMGGGSASKAAVERAAAHGMNAVVGHCPYMFLPGTPFVHGLHGMVKKLTGSYPKTAAAR